MMLAIYFVSNGHLLIIIRNKYTFLIKRKPYVGNNTPYRYI